VDQVVARLSQLPDRRFAPEEPVIALTFDDGPGPTTAALAEALAELDLPATFFVVGAAAAADPAQVTALAEAGHTVGVHSWSHSRGSDLDDDALVDEYRRTAELVAELTGCPPRYVRPTYQPADGPRYAALLGPLGFTTVTWSLDPRDWERPDPAALARRVLDELHPGAIAVLHDGGGDRTPTLAALPAIVHGARVAGYRFAAL
jgi:peptidoglycan/xylan/chitin deacetylase (PgdA/CDA1 family)